MLPVWGSRAQTQKCPVREATQMEIFANHPAPRRTRRVASGTKETSVETCAWCQIEMLTAVRLSLPRPSPNPKLIPTTHLWHFTKGLVGTI